MPVNFPLNIQEQNIKGLRLFNFLSFPSKKEEKGKIYSPISSIFKGVFVYFLRAQETTIKKFLLFIIKRM